MHVTSAINPVVISVENMSASGNDQNMKATKPKRKSKTEIYIDKDVYEFIKLYKELFGFPKPSHGLRLVWSNGKRITYND